MSRITQKCNNFQEMAERCLNRNPHTVVMLSVMPDGEVNVDCLDLSPEQALLIIQFAQEVVAFELPAGGETIQ
jgi:hypothetical protein